MWAIDDVAPYRHLVAFLPVVRRATPASEQCDRASFVAL
jgi:hypothetical protein